MYVAPGSTDVTKYFHIKNSDGTDATGKTITDFDLQYTRSGSAAAASIRNCLRRRNQWLIIT